MCWKSTAPATIRSSKFASSRTTSGYGSRLQFALQDLHHRRSAHAHARRVQRLAQDCWKNLPRTSVKFIFATTEPQKVLPTITSRCQRFDLHRIPANLIAEHLQFIAKKEKIKLAPAAASSIARGAEGGLRDAESMLDQLVAFCGENIEEPDVLKVFGFTSQQTVAAFTEKIMRSETATAVQLLHDECEAGKDMMRLMSDLITYLRDLLIYKAKPEALSGDVDTESQQNTGGAIRFDRNGPAAGVDSISLRRPEGQHGEWAPNKKLHFEVALIKAIQSLNQVTLGQVIETLKALREGKAEPSRPSAAPAPPSVKAIPAKSNPLPAPAKPVARVAERSEPPAKATTPPGKIDPAATWAAVLAKVPPRGFLRNVVDLLTPIGVEARSFRRSRLRSGSEVDYRNDRDNEQPPTTSETLVQGNFRPGSEIKARSAGKV